MTSDAILLFTVIPLFGSFVTLIEKVIPSLKVAKPVALGSFFLSVLLLGLFAEGIYGGAVYSKVVGGWPRGIGIGQELDGIAWVALALMYLIYLPVLLYSFSEGGYDSRFYFFLLLLQGGMAGIVLAFDVFNLFVFLEITGIAAYVLIGYQKKDRALFAGFKYLMLSSLGITLFLLGVFLFYRDTGSLTYTDLRGWAQDGLAPAKTATSFAWTGIPFALATLLAGIGVRTAFLPYTWLPDAHGFAPHPISASLSGVVIKVSFLVVWKLIVLLELPGARQFLLWMGSAIALIGVLRALTQVDVKVLLAWHSVSQMGYIFAGFGAGTEIGTVGSLYHMVSHAFFKALLFLSVGTVILFTGERTLKKVSGMGRLLPYLSVLFAIGALSIMGVPPFVGYVSKKLIFEGLQDHPVAYWMLFASSVGTVASFTKLSLLFRGSTQVGDSKELPGTEEERTTKGTSLKQDIGGVGPFPLTSHLRPFRSAYLGMSLLAVLCVLGGLFGTYGIRFFSSIIQGPVIQRPAPLSGPAMLIEPATRGQAVSYGSAALGETAASLEQTPLYVSAALNGLEATAHLRSLPEQTESITTIWHSTSAATARQGSHTVWKGAAFLWLNGKEYLKTIVTLLLGYGVYRFIVSKRGKEVQEWANRLRISFDNQLVLLLLGLVLLVVFLANSPVQ